MNRNLFIALAAFVVLAIGGAAFLSLANNGGRPAQERSSNSAAENQSTPESIDQDAGNSETARYVDYSPDVISTTSGTRLLFFHAPWCPQCRMLEADIKEKGVPEGVTIIKVDYDTNQELRQKYGVTIQTTVVKIDDDGKLVEKFIPYSEPTLEAVKENLL